MSKIGLFGKVLNMAHDHCDETSLSMWLRCWVGMYHKSPLYIPNWGWVMFFFIYNYRMNPIEEDNFFNWKQLNDLVSLSGLIFVE